MEEFITFDKVLFIREKREYSLPSYTTSLHGTSAISQQKGRDNKVKIFINDEFGPESSAMMQALYSRSSASVEKHIEQVRKAGSSNFMKSYYVGYGHASIGDCGTTTLFLEGVSILAAKAIQDNPLYSGQETSTRYIDFSSQPLIDPVSTEESQDILKDWIKFYTTSTEVVRSYLKDRFPLEPGQQPNIWKKAINARGFDILRGFLPAGATTQLSWSTNLRQAYDKLCLLKLHPLNEVRLIAEAALKKLSTKYPSSFSHTQKDETEKYYNRFSKKIHYSSYTPSLSEEDFLYRTDIDNKLLEDKEHEVIGLRPKGALLPRYISKYGRYNCTFLLDYGSYRDLQRHRNGLCRLPVLTINYGFNQWYLNQLPAELRNQANILIKKQFHRIKELTKRHSLSSAETQYYIPMGSNIVCELVYDLPEMVYVVELRSSSTVHPTLRRIAHNMYNTLKNNHPALKLHADLSRDKFEVKRGLQDIEKIN
ncbi:Thymidylate synthase complementing protein [Candidatus Electrothrix aarhusensis]|uniref:Thymidylate synthase complementing protein n=1 Tax=Candidatus Electrothrix aarhusensis TaxID=1859131 RepID=A0A444IYU4_9BACT|nr:Thymidylate synthase complementing protein [Candidatus Electrothrix aarhusensis]